MRLSPPVTILAIVAAAIAWLAFSRNFSDCAYAPDGNLRWNNINEWFQTDDDQVPPCDVWRGIKPRKPIGIIEIEYGSASLRIFPDGNTSAIFLKDWRDQLGYFETLDPPRFRTTTELQSAGYTVIEGRAKTGVYEQVRALIAPLRDFTAWREPSHKLPDMLEWSEPGESADFLRHIVFDLDDPRTKIGICHHEISDSGAGWAIHFWEPKTKEHQSWSFYHHIGCADPAARSGRDRANRAAELIMAATRSTALIEKRNENFSPSLP